MKRSIAISALIFLASLATMAGAQPDFPGSQVAPRYRLTITSVRAGITGPKGMPITPLENRTPMSLELTIEVQPFVAGAPVPIVPAWVCVADRGGECDRSRAPVWPIPQLGAGTLHATVNTAAPVAGNAARFRLNLCQGNRFAESGAPCGKVLAIAESRPFAVAARYSLELLEVAIEKIRSPHNDTIFATLVGDPHSDAPLCGALCAQAFLSVNSPAGSRIRKGLPGTLGGLQIGPFTRVPVQDEDIWIGYSLINLGGKYDDDGDANLARIKELQAEALRYTKAGLTFRTEGDYPSVELNTRNLRWSGCDGPLIGRIFPLHNSGSGATLFTLTESTGRSELANDKDISPDLNIFGDDCHQPRYRVTWRLWRDSWRN